MGRICRRTKSVELFARIDEDFQGEIHLDNVHFTPNGRLLPLGVHTLVIELFTTVCGRARDGR